MTAHELMIEIDTDRSEANAISMKKPTTRKDLDRKAQMLINSADNHAEELVSLQSEYHKEIEIIEHIHNIMYLVEGIELTFEQAMSVAISTGRVSA